MNAFCIALSINWFSNMITKTRSNAFSSIVSPLANKSPFDCWESEVHRQSMMISLARTFHGQLGVSLVSTAAAQDDREEALAVSARFGRKSKVHPWPRPIKHYRCSVCEPILK